MGCVAPCISHLDSSSRNQGESTIELRCNLAAISIAFPISTPCILYPIAFGILWSPPLSWPATIRSAHRKYGETAGKSIRAEAQNKLDMPGARFTGPRVRVFRWYIFLKAYSARIPTLVATESKTPREVRV